MIALLQVEVRRLLARRLFRVISTLVLLAFLFAGVMAYLTSSDDPRAIAAASATHRAEVDACIQHLEAGAARGEAGPPEAQRNPHSFCESERWMRDPRFNYSETTWILSTFAVPLIMLGLLVGSSSVGAEWSQRTITTLLTWEPRRTRVLAARGGAIALVVFAWALALQAIFMAAVYPAAALRGTLGGIDGEWWSSLLQLAGRAAALCVLGAMIGLALATIGRNSAAAFGVAAAYLTAGEGLIRGFKPSWIDWLVGDNVVLVLMGPADVNHVNHSQGGAALLLLAYMVCLLAVAAAVFHRRDIA